MKPENDRALNKWAIKINFEMLISSLFHDVERQRDNNPNFSFEI